MTVAPFALSFPDFPGIGSLMSRADARPPRLRSAAVPRPLSMTATRMTGTRALALPLTAALLLGATLAGCGKSLPGEGRGHSAGVTTVPGTGALAASGLATKNTTRVGGADPIADAAAVALTVNPGLTPATRPAAVVLVNAHDWTAALAASALSGAPLGAPLLYSEGGALPAISSKALGALKPRGSALLGGAQVIAIDTSASPAGYRT